MNYLVNHLISQMSSFVYLFFIISGFSMCCGYYEKIKDNQISLNQFYKRRYAKILPFFTLLVLMDLAVSLVLEGKIGIGSLYEAFADLTLMFGLFPASDITVIGVGWTLGVTIAGESVASYIIACIGTISGPVIFATVYQCIEKTVKRRLIV